MEPQVNNRRDIEPFSNDTQKNKNLIYVFYIYHINWPSDKYWYLSFCEYIKIIHCQMWSRNNLPTYKGCKCLSSAMRFTYGFIQAQKCTLYLLDTTKILKLLATGTRLYKHKYRPCIRTIACCKCVGEPAKTKLCIAYRGRPCYAWLLVARHYLPSSAKIINLIEVSLWSHFMDENTHITRIWH